MEPIVRSISNKEGEITDAESEPAPKSSSSSKRRTVAERAGVSSGASLQSMELETGHLVADEIPDEQEDMDNEEEEEEEEDEYEYEDDEDAAFSGFLVDNPAFAVAQATVASKEQSQQPPEEDEQPATIEEEVALSSGEAAAAPNNNKKWRQPTKQAVNMSLRAEQEKTGGKRRLAQDLFRIMQQDTVEAGFSLKPSSEDSMDKWTIQLFQFDEDSNLAKDMRVLGLENIELEMSFPDQYPFEPPFVRVTRPRFKRQTGFVMNGALCMELLTTDGWNPVNDIESVIVSIRSLLVVGDGRLEAAVNLTEAKYKTLLEDASEKPAAQPDAGSSEDTATTAKRKREVEKDAQKKSAAAEQQRRMVRDQGGSYSVSEAEAAYTHLSDYHKKKGWDTSGWWARKG